MKIYPPSHFTPKESQRDAEVWHQSLQDMEVSGQVLEEYVDRYIQRYRNVMDRFFPKIATALPFYLHYPYKTIIVRIGRNGVFFGHQPASSSSSEIIDVKELVDPSVPLNINDIISKLQTPFTSFDFRVRTYGDQEAELEGTQAALRDALEYFWSSLSDEDFSDFCYKLLNAKGLDFDFEIEAPDPNGFGYDALGDLLISEPAGFRRFERWSFSFKHYRSQRISAKYLREIEDRISNSDSFDIVCLITSGDLTSIGNYIATKNPRIRVWDRYVLNGLIHQNLSVLEPYFADYSSVVLTLTEEFQQTTTIVSRYQEFEKKLGQCPPGQKNFAQYEKIGVEIWQYLFSSTLGEPKTQPRTADGTQRRDVLFRNNRQTKFFQRIANRFSADFIIVDFKNYKDPLSADVIDSVSKYANKALGKFIIVVSRKGVDALVETVQVRIFRDEDTMI